MENIFPVNKKYGTPSSNGCYRLHPVEWSIGEANLGMFVPFLMENGKKPQEVYTDAAEVRKFQSPHS